MAASRKICSVCSKELDAEESVCSYCKTPYGAPGSDYPRDALFESSRGGPPPAEDDGQDYEIHKALAKKKLKSMLLLIVGGLFLVLVVMAPKEMKWLGSQWSKWVIGERTKLQEAAGVEVDKVEDPSTPKVPAPPKPPPEPKSILATGDQVPEGKGRWTIEGRLFDIATLKPLPKAKLYFQDGTTKELFHTITNSKGFYRAVLQERATGYELEIEHPGYFVKYVEDWLPSIRKFGPERRGEIAKDIDRQRDRLETFLGMDGQLLKRDLALVLHKQLKPEPRPAPQHPQ